MEAFARFSPLVEPLSLDEAFLDMTGAERLMGSPRQMAQALKQEVRRVTDGLTVSVGVAPTKYVAKVASDWNKPDGLTVVAADQVLDFLWPLPVKHLWGVGPRMQRNLAAMGLVRIGQVAHADEALLQRRLGRLGPHLRRLAWGQDERAVVPPGQAKSVGAEVTLEHDVLGHQAVAQRLRPLAREVARRLRANGLMAQGVRVKVKTASFRLLTRQSQLDGPTTSSGQLLSAALDLLPQFDLDVPSRLVGLAAFQLVPGDRPRQGELFPSPQQVQQHRTERLESTIDELQRRFGAQAIHFGDEEPPDGDSGDPPPR
jgi:DNA polymerase-4